MNFASIALLALAMSTDAFAAAVGKGTALHKPQWSEALRTGAIFGVIEMLTPLVGWALGFAAAKYVQEWDHWIAFVLLGVLGLRMIWAGFSGPDKEEAPQKPDSHSFWVLAVTGFATSIDAMAVGVGLAFLDVNILPVAAAIGFTTFVMVTLGVMVGRVLGAVAGKWAEIVGGVLLIGIGTTILVEHLHAA
jgi:putative Mn2+ efflux pump MntP